MKYRLSSLVVLAALLGAAWTGPAHAAEQGVVLKSGDRLTAEITPSDEDAFDIDLPEGGSVDFSVAATKTSTLLPMLRLVQPDGVELVLGPFMQGVGTPVVKLRRLVVPFGQTGRWQVRVGGMGDSVGAYEVAAVVISPPPVASKGVTVPAGERRTIPFVADSLANVTVTVRTTLGTRPAALWLSDPSGADVPDSDKAFRQVKKKPAKGKLQLRQGFGFYNVIVEGAADGESTIDVSVAVKVPRAKPRRITLPAEAQIDGIDPGTIRQEDTGAVVRLNGSNFLEGTHVVVEGEGVELTSMTVESAGTLKLELDVAADAPYGTRRVVVLPPATLGESLAIEDAFTVRAPDPTVTDVIPAIVGQDTSGTFVVTGTGFRSGGTLATTDSGVSLSSVAMISPTELRAQFAVAASATLSSRDLTYTQPAAGGGATTTRTGAYLVLKHGPEFTLLTPAVLNTASSNVSMRVYGAYFEPGTTIAFTGTGLTIHSKTFIDASRIDLTVSLALDASVGSRSLTITPEPGGGAPLTVFAALVVPAMAPSITSFSHGTLGQGLSGFPVTVTGSNFRTGDTLTVSGSGVSFSGETVLGTSTIHALVSVAPGALTSSRTLTVTHTAAEGARSGARADAFQIVGAIPGVVAANPSAIGVTGVGGPTREVPVRFTGLNFMSGATVSVARAGGSGISVVPGSETVVSTVRIDATLSVAGSASPGLWDVTVTNPGGIGSSGATGAGLLDVKPASALTVNRVTASSGGVYGGERVTVYGSGFVTGSTVDFGAVRAAGTQILDANTLVTTVPIPAATSKTGTTSVDVIVSTPSPASATLKNGWSYAKDDVRFVTLATFPAQGATSVPRNLKSAVVVLSAPLDPSTGLYGIIAGWNTFWFESGGNYTANGFRGIGPGGRFLVLSRTTAVANLETNVGGEYVLDLPISFHSIGGNVFVPTRLLATESHDQQTFTLSASATDTTAPTLTSVSPTDGSTNQDPMASVTLTFSEAIDPITVTLSTITLKQGGTSVPATIALTNDLRTVTITPLNELAANTTFAIGVTASVTDLCGNGVSPVTDTFTTGGGNDGVKPSIDACVVESLPASMDGSGTYVGSGGAPGQAFDLYVPRSGWSLDVEFSDAGGSGVDETTFSAKCSVAVGGNAANAELASNFTVTSTGASWRIPAASPVTAAENVSFTFAVRDKSGNTSNAKSITLDVADKDGTAANGGDLDATDGRRSWVLRTDTDSFSAAFTQTTVPMNQRGATTTVAQNGVTDLDEALVLIGLESQNMTAQASVCVNGPDTGTNAIARRLFVERLRELLHERFGIDADGTHRANSVDVEFLLPGEQGSLATTPTYSTANSSNSPKPFSEFTLGGTLSADSTPYSSSPKVGDGWFDDRNHREEANLNLGGANDTGIYLLGAFKLQVSANELFRARISNQLVVVHGGTPVGENASDDDVLAGSFDRVSSSNGTLNARYDAIMDAIEYAALYASAITAHEIGHSMGLVADGAPKTGLFGAAHYNNAFTEATSLTPNTPKHLDYLGNDLMAGVASFDATALTGSDFKRFSPLDIAYLLDRLLYDEGK